MAFGPAFLPSFVLFHIFLFIARLIDWLVFGFTTRGRDILRTVKTALLVSNHTLVVDPGVVAHAIRPHATYYTVLEETALIPFLGTFVRLLGAIPLAPNSLGELENAAKQALAGNRFLHFFPEGECYLWNQQIRPFHGGAFYLACRLGVPIIPITTVLRERNLFGRSSFTVFRWTLRVPPRVTAIVGEPLMPEAFLGSIGPKGSLTSQEVSREAQALLWRAAHAMSESARTQMQRAIDRERGSKSLYRGMMPRVALQKSR